MRAPVIVTIGNCNNRKRGRSERRRAGVRPLLRGRLAYAGGTGTGRIAAEVPRGLRIRLRRRCRFFADALFFWTAAITVSSAPLVMMYSLRRASMYAVVVAFSWRFSDSCWAFSAATSSRCSAICTVIFSASVPRFSNAFASLPTAFSTSSANPRICACPYDPMSFSPAPLGAGGEFDVVYQRLVSRVLLALDPAVCRITLDDYGIGKNLRGFLDVLAKQGAEVRVEAKSDEKYVEARVASVLAKWRRQQAMRGVATLFSLPDTPVGSGNAGDSVTLDWLRRWKETGKPWPWFVKTSFKTVRELEGKEGKATETSPPIRHELLSPDARERLAEGQLSTASLSLVCPECGATLTAAKLTPEPARGLLGRCLSCTKVITELDTTLRYYSGVALLDASVIIAGSISKDLERQGFFDGFALLLHPTVAAETDTEGGRAELTKLANYAAMGRVDWHALRRTSTPPEDRHDEAIMETAKQLNAILVTRDGGMYGNAVARGIFCLTFRT